MIAQTRNFQVDGSSALAIENPRAQHAAHIVKFPAHASKRSPVTSASRNSRLVTQMHTLGHGMRDLLEAAASTLHAVLDASEMYCSLKFEDVRGCSYGVFGKHGIAVLALASAIVSGLAIAFGA